MRTRNDECDADDDGDDENDDNGYRAWWARFILPRAHGVLAESARVRERVLSGHKVADAAVDVVPRYIDVVALTTATPNFTMKERYPKFTFTMLVVARLAQEERIDFIINAAQHTLHQYPSMGLIIVGVGPELKALQTLVREKGLMNNVVFETNSDEYISYMKSAGMLLQLHDSSTSEESLMCAAAVGLPVITTTSLSLGNVFTNTESGVVCTPGDIGCVIKGIALYINDSLARSRYSSEASSRLSARSAESGDNNLTLFRQLIEKALFSYSVPSGIVAEQNTSENATM